MSKLKKFLTPEGAQALRDFATAMPTAVENIIQSTEKLINIYRSASEDLGAHSDSFGEMLDYIRKAQEKASEAIEELPKGLEITASKINAYLAKKPSVPGTTAASKDLGSSVTTEKYRATHRNVPVLNNVSHASDTENFDSLVNYLDSKYNIYIDDSVKQLDFETVRNSIEGVESIIDEFPDVGTFLKSGITSNSGVMSCSGSKLSFNPQYFNDKQLFIDTCNTNSKMGFWVSNSSPKSIGVHEAAHGVEWALIQANPSYVYDYDKTIAWNNCNEATLIVVEACRNIQKTQYGIGKTQTELIQAISSYALKDDSETMAEAFADVSANGINANPLSIEIKRLTKEQMEKYKGGRTC